MIDCLFLKATAETQEQRQKPVVIDYDLLQARAFIPLCSGGRIGWEAADPSDVLDWFCFVDTQGKGSTVVHDLVCPGVGSSGSSKFVPGSLCPKRYASESRRVSFVLQIQSGLP